MTSGLAVALFHRKGKCEEDPFRLTLGVLRFGGFRRLLAGGQKRLQYGTPGSPYRSPRAAEGASAPHTRNVIFVVRVHRTTAYIGLKWGRRRVLRKKISEIRILKADYRRTTVIARHDELPLASYARTVTTVLPTSNGTSADQDVVPAAVPESPLEVDHFTEETPLASEAVPAIRIEDDVVETIVPDGESTWSAGAVVSDPLGVVGGVGTGVVGSVGFVGGVTGVDG